MLPEHMIAWIMIVLRSDSAIGRLKGTKRLEGGRRELEELAEWNLLILGSTDLHLLSRMQKASSRMASKSISLTVRGLKQSNTLQD
jgi:hypothetical protein